MKDARSRSGLNFKKSNIRIWIHQRNMANLQQVVWEGHGTKLLVEHSNNPKMKKFLEAVPFIMGLIKDVHCDVQNDDLENLKNRIAPPVPIAVLTAQDSNGLTPLHKAVGLGRTEIVEYIVNEVPSSINAVDNEGRRPLHYAALVKDDNKMFTYLIENGADESALDNRQKTAAYYKTRTSELDPKLLQVLPDCPRCAKEPANFDWSMLTSAALPINGAIRKTVQKAENGLGEKIVETSKPGEDTEQNEETKEEEMKIEHEAECETANETEDEPEPPTDNGNEEHGESGEFGDDESQEKSIEGHSPDAVDTPKEEHEENEMEVVQDGINDEAQNETLEEKEIPDEEIPNTAEADNEIAGEAIAEEPLESEPNNENKDKDSLIKDIDDENNNEPTTKNPEDDSEETLTDNPVDGDAEGSRTRPSSRNIRTPSANKSRPVSQASNHTRPGTVVKEKEEQNGHHSEHEDEPEKVVDEPELEGEGVIEGVVNGENEVEPMNNEGQNHLVMDDPDIKAMIDSGNMEQLAALVLNGDGDKLIGQKTDNQELQTFLDNVSIYMSKIRRIHIAARDGSLRDLQAALDRRKFAVARDNISPNGASPLHVAVAFSRTSVVRYLAGRFPETIHVEDDNGRTPLHYAAVLRDNGHYYNLLMHLGADNRLKDKSGRTPEDYIKRQDEFNHRQILIEFGADDEAEEMLNDKVPNDLESARKNFDDEDMLSVLDRCFNVLHGRRNSNAISATSTNTVSSVITKPSTYSCIISKHMKRYTFDKVKFRLTKLDHNLYDVIWPSVKKLPTEASIRHALEEDFPLGIVAPDLHIYKVFGEFLEPIIKDYNYLDVYRELDTHPTSEFLQDKTESDFDLDTQVKWVITDIVSNEINEENGQVDMPFFATEEGRYLASTLGDPLIKGLTEVANKRPKDPIAYLATYLYNFAHNRDGTKSRGRTQEEHHQQVITGGPQTVNDNNAVPATIDVVTVEPDDDGTESESAFNNTSRDEHGQSMLHFAAARAHGRNALFQLLLETEINVAFRDELYRTARDISIQANIPGNTTEIDRYVLHIATKGDTNKLVELLLDGYDHITDIVDEDDMSIIEAVSRENQSETVSFLQSILAFEEKRERVHHAIRQGSIADAMALLADENDTGSGKLLAIGKNSYGRCSLHIAVLCQQEEIVDYLANTFVDTLRIGDNLQRTALHYAMGVEKMETISRLLIKAGAKRVVKDLKGRQPTYYFLNKSDILRLQEEEETF